jgi:cell division protein FtsQ
MSRRRKKNILQVAVEQKKRARVSSGRLALLCGGATLIGLLGLGFYVATERVLEYTVFTNPDFSIRNIEVVHAGEMSRREILDWSGIRPGENLFRTDLSKARKRLLSVPTVSRVTVRRQIPDTVSIQVEERLPVARLVPYSTNRYQLAQTVYYVDGNGYVMKPKEGERLKPLPEIIGIPADEIIVGEKIRRQEVYSALTLLKWSDHHGLRSELDLDRIEVQRKGYLIVRTPSRGLIRFRNNFIDEQIKRLQYILAHCRSKQRVVRTVDLTPERNVAVTLY